MLNSATYCKMHWKKKRIDEWMDKDIQNKHSKVVLADCTL